jgi:hypothetical protein
MGMFVNVRCKLWGVGVHCGAHIGMVVHKEPLGAHNGVSTLAIPIR